MLLHNIDVINEVQKNPMEKSKKEAIIPVGKIIKRLLEGGTQEIDAQEGSGLAVIISKAMHEQNHL